MIRRAIPFIVVILAFGCLLILSPNANVIWSEFRTQLADWQAFARDQRLLAALVFVLVYTVVTGLSLPMATAFSLLAGALFGRWLGTILAVSAATIGATVAFWGSRYFFREWVRERFGARLATVDAGFARDGAFYLLTLRLMPMLPFFLINLAMGLTPIRTRVYSLVSWFGMMPGAFVIVNVGTTAANIESLHGLVSREVLIALMLLATLPLGARWLVRRRASVAAKIES